MTASRGWSPITRPGRRSDSAAPRRSTPTEVEIGASWSLLLYSDGIYEGRVRSPARAPGDRRVARDGRPSARNERDKLDPEQLIERVEELNGGPLDDDVALLALTRDAAGELERGAAPPRAVTAGCASAQLVALVDDRAVRGRAGRGRGRDRSRSRTSRASATSCSTGSSPRTPPGSQLDDGARRPGDRHPGLRAVGEPEFLEPYSGRPRRPAASALATLRTHERGRQLGGAGDVISARRRSGIGASRSRRSRA